MEDFKIGFRYVVEDNMKELAVVVCDGNWIPVRQIGEAMGLIWQGFHQKKAKNFHAESRKVVGKSREVLCLHLDHLQAWLDSFRPGLIRAADPKRVEHFIGNLVPTLSRALLYDPTASESTAPDSTIYVGRKLSMEDKCIKFCTEKLHMLPTDAKNMIHQGAVVWRTPSKTYPRTGFVLPPQLVYRNPEDVDHWSVELTNICKAGIRVQNMGEIEVQQGHPVDRVVGQTITRLDTDGTILSRTSTPTYSWEKNNETSTQLLAAPHQPVRTPQAVS